MKYIPFHKPNIPTTVFNGIKGVINSGWITTGNKVHLLESSVSKKIGAKYAVAVSSGTAALHLAYLAAGIGRGDEVIVPSYTFCSTINTIIHTGAKPIFCDIQEDTLCLDPKDVEKKSPVKLKQLLLFILPACQQT